MTNEHWEEIERIADPTEAEILRGLFEAQGIQVWLAQEGAARAIGLSFTPMGEVSLMVPASQVSRAQEVLAQYYDGSLENEAMDTEFPAKEED